MSVIRTAVLDSGPLFSALVANYVILGERNGRRGSSAASHLNAPLDTRTAQQEFLTLLAGIKEKLVTSHVIGELRGLETSRLRLYGDDQKVFWSTSIDLLLQWSIDETLVRVLDLCETSELKNRILQIGPTDTALIDLARARNCTLITEDERTLAREAWRINVDCRLVRQLIPHSTP